MYCPKLVIRPLEDRTENSIIGDKNKKEAFKNKYKKSLYKHLLDKCHIAKRIWKKGDKANEDCPYSGL